MFAVQRSVCGVRLKDGPGIFIGMEWWGKNLGCWVLPDHHFRVQLQPFCSLNSDLLRVTWWNDSFCGTQWPHLNMEMMNQKRNWIWVTLTPEIIDFHIFMLPEGRPEEKKEERKRVRNDSAPRTVDIQGCGHRAFPGGVGMSWRPCPEVLVQWGDVGNLQEPGLPGWG